MPRTARKKSKTGIYHIMVRGINRQEIFHSEEDFRKYMEILERTKNISGCEIYGYCLMGNHIHLVIKETNEDIGRIMKRIGASYANWYNWKYERVGHVFQDRYKSECVEDDSYLMTVIRYVHSNPVVAGMMKLPEEYKWSSTCAYYLGKEYPGGITNTAVVLGLFGGNKKSSIEEFKQFTNQENDDKCLEDIVRIKASDEEVLSAILKLLKGNDISSLGQMERKERDDILHQAKEIKGSSIRQISRITGIGYNIIVRA